MNIPRILIRALLLCNYRTNFYDDFKQLCYKIEALYDINAS